MNAIELQRCRVGANRNVEQQSILDALCPDETAFARLGVHAARAGDQEDIAVWVDERKPGVGVNALVSDGRREHNGIDACCGKGQEAEY